MRLKSKRLFLSIALLIPWFAQVVFFWDMSGLSNAPRLISIIATLLAIVAAISPSHDFRETILILLAPLVIVFAAILIICVSLFRVDIMWLWLFLLWGYDVFFVIFYLLQGLR